MKNLWLIIALFLLAACKQNTGELYQSDEFSISSNEVIQGSNKARVESPTKIVSNYKSLASESYSRLLSFKFSINEKDNEKPGGINHWIIVGDEHQSPIITFGQIDQVQPDDLGTKLPVNYAYTFRLDMNPVISQFKEKGYYEAFDGTKIAESDFKNVYIAGGSDPLSWDFSNLDENGLALADPDADGIYELSVVLNPYDLSQDEIKSWELSQDISDKPSYTSDQKIVDALFNLSLEEALIAIEPDSTLRTGAKWGGVWTRDVSYSIFLAFAYHEPEVAKISLLRKVKRKRIIQDTGSGGAWPVSSDRTTWAIAAWELYKVTGDKVWLEQAHEIIKNTLDDDFLTLNSSETGMYKGESSFLDWREQTYPKWMQNMDIYVSENLGTNVLHYQAHMILVEMAKILNCEAKVYEERANQIKAGINNYLWMEDKGYYAQYLYGRSSLMVSPRYEALGEALAVLFNVANEAKAKSIIEKSPLTAYGATCIYPQIPGIAPYHNNGIWPFVQSYWNLAAAKVGNGEVLNHGLAAIYRAGSLFLTNYENFVAETGDYYGTEINSHRMLWSMAGNMAMVHRVFMGMNFEPNGLRFNPVVPENYKGIKKLSNFKYRDAMLSITVSGFGNVIESITLDGEPLKDAFLPADIKGAHTIEIKLDNNALDNGGINLVDNKFSLTDPKTNYANDTLSWNAISGAVKYNIYKNGKLWQTQESNALAIIEQALSEYAVTTVDAEGMESFASEPLFIGNKNDIQIIEIEKHIKASNLTYTNYSGTGFVKISKSKNTAFEIPITCQTSGTYLIDFRYANGSGPWNTDNNCGIRSIYVNNNYESVMIFPQRGSDEWSDWGYSNSVKVKLEKGRNTVRMVLEDWNTNMDGDINEALLDYLRLVKLSN